MTVTHPTLSCAPTWAALGVQHAILARAMPVVRHDIAGMLTIMRMAAVVLRRRAQDASEPLSAQLEQQEEHLASLSDSTRRLRHWDLQGPHAPEPIATTVQLARDLASPLLAMRGLQLQLPSPEEPPLPATRVPQQPLLCLLLGAVHLLAESPAGPPASVRILPGSQGAGSLRVQAEGVAADAPPAAPTPGMPALDGAALAHLAQHLGAGWRHGPGWAEIDTPLPA
ncbi:hypothetical protein [Pulveribacter suum]|uniref:Histidine kinase n=1 Tax=Pulveribacter suum TaxID=2116657 RepID=A0A2P1NNG8_9BURK|nr:hypothetical protein [Pulveribacter suum]AVP58595.1 hypothetical protein C7H73_13605 [Pulveribacter suum]